MRYVILLLNTPLIDEVIQGKLLYLLLHQKKYQLLQRLL